MFVEEVFAAEPFASVHFVHFTQSGFHSVNGSEDIEGVTSFGYGVHVANWKADRCRGTVDSGKGGRHGVGSGIPAGKVDLVRDIGLLAGFLDDAVYESACD